MSYNNGMRWKKILVIVGLAWIVYGPTLKIGFLWDDHFLIKHNPAIQQWSWPQLAQDFRTGIFNDAQKKDFFRPLVTLSNRINFSLGGLDPLGYHLVNLLFLTGTAVCAALLAQMVGASPSVSLFVGASYAVHPAIVQNLLMVSGRDELMSTGFFLAALFFLLKPGIPFHLLGILLFWGAMLSKESAIVLPVVFAGLLWYRQAPRHRYWRLSSLVLSAGLFLWWYFKVIKPDFPPLSFRLGLNFYTQGFPHMVAHYLRLAYLPFNLYSDPLIVNPGPIWMAFTAGFFAWMGWIMGVRNRLAILCTFWLVLILIPKSILTLTHSLIHDHWLYPGLWPVVFAMGHVLSKGWTSPQSQLKKTSLAMTIGLLLFWGGISQFHIWTRGTDEKNYRRSLTFKTTPVMRNNLVAILLEEGRYAEALPYLRQMVEESPQDLNLRNALTQTLQKMNQKGP